MVIFQFDGVGQEETFIAWDVRWFLRSLETCVYSEAQCGGGER